MRTWIKPSWTKEQETSIHTHPERFAEGMKVFIKNHANNGKTFLHFGHKPFPAVDLIIDGKTYTFDSEELMTWLRHV